MHFTASLVSFLPCLQLRPLSQHSVTSHGVKRCISSKHSTFPHSFALSYGINLLLGVDRACNWLWSLAQRGLQSRKVDCA